MTGGPVPTERGPSRASVLLCLTLYSALSHHARAQDTMADRAQELLDLNLSYFPILLENTTEVATDREILLSFKDTRPPGDCIHCADGPVFGTWTNESSICDWVAEVQTEGAGDDWRGVIQCLEETQQALKIDLSYMGISGPLPKSFGQLPMIAHMHFEVNMMTGALPEEWSTLGAGSTNLHIDLRSNLFGGTIPDSWVSHHSLDFIDFGSNVLSGPLPSAWSGNTRLKELNLAANKLSGPLPEEWSQITQLVKLNVGSNQLNGTLPITWSTLGKLDQLDVSSSGSLTGPLPPAWSSMTSLANLKLSDNELTGTVPPKWVTIESLTFMDISSNLLDTSSVDNMKVPTTWFLEPQDLPPPPSLPEPDPGPLLIQDNLTPPAGEGGVIVIGSNVPLLIGVVVAALLAVLLALAIWYWLRRRRASKYLKDETDEESDGSAVSSLKKECGEVGLGVVPSVVAARRSSHIKQLRKRSGNLQNVVGQCMRANMSFDDLCQPLVDLHEFMPAMYKELPVRLLKADYVKTTKYLASYEELSNMSHTGRDECFVDISYNELHDSTWDSTVVLSWRWSCQKPRQPQEGFCPISPLQLKEFQSRFGNADFICNMAYVWVDWACVPQYKSSPMPEIARSKLYYGRAAVMTIVPEVKPLDDGARRVVLSGLVRALEDKAATISFRSASESASMSPEEQAAVAMGRLKRHSVQYCHEYFGRVWTLAERMSRHGREERLKHWIPLDVWLSMTLDAAWASSDPACPMCTEKDAPCFVGATFWQKLFDPEVAHRGISSLMQVRKAGSNLISDEVRFQMAELFVVAVRVWSTSAVTEELSAKWLRDYLQKEALYVYQSWDSQDAVWAIFSFFCWHVRTPAEIAEAHEDLCRVAEVPKRDTRMAQVIAGCAATARDDGVVEASSLPAADSLPVGDGEWRKSTSMSAILEMQRTKHEDACGPLE